MTLIFAVSIVGFLVIAALLPERRAVFLGCAAIYALWGFRWVRRQRRKELDRGERVDARG